MSPARELERGRGDELRYIRTFDAEQECSHERLPTDPTPPCGCFPGIETPKPARVPDLMSVLSIAQRGANMAATAAAPRVTREDVLAAARTLDGKFSIDDLRAVLPHASKESLGQHLRRLVADRVLYAEGATKSRRFHVVTGDESAPPALSLVRSTDGGDTPPPAEEDPILAALDHLRDCARDRSNERHEIEVRISELEGELIDLRERHVFVSTGADKAQHAVDALEAVVA